MPIYSPSGGAGGGLAEIPDPFTPTDGTWNITGGLAVSSYLNADGGLIVSTLATFYTDMSIIKSSPVINSEPIQLQVLRTRCAVAPADNFGTLIKYTIENEFNSDVDALHFKVKLTDVSDSIEAAAIGWNIKTAAGSLVVSDQPQIGMLGDGTIFATTSKLTLKQSGLATLSGSVDIVGNLIAASTSADVTVNSTVTRTAGQLFLVQNNATEAFSINASTGFMKSSISDSGTNTTIDALALYRRTTGTAAALLGVSISSYLEDASGNDELASIISTIWDVATNGGEYSDIVFQTKVNGSMSESARFFAAGAATNKGLCLPASSRITFGTKTAQNSLQVISTSTRLMTFQLAQSLSGFYFASTSAAATSGAYQFLKFENAIVNTGQTAGTEIIGVEFKIGAGRSWATGAIASQREFVIKAPTYAFTAASTMTNAYTFCVEAAPIQGTNATITNSYAAWFGGNIRLDATTDAAGGGAAATLATIGGTGPATAGQNLWVRININGTPMWIPAWV